MKGRKIPNRLAGPPPVAEAIPTPAAPGKIAPPNLVIPAAASSMMAEEATRQKKRKRKKQNDLAEVTVVPSPSPCPPVTPEPNVESPRLLSPEPLFLEVVAAVRGTKRDEAAPSIMAEEEATRQKKRKRKKQKDQAEVPMVPSPSPSPLVTPDPNVDSLRSLSPEILSSEVDAAVKGGKREENPAAPSMMAEEEATRLMKWKRKKQNEQVEVPVAPSPSPFHPVPLEPKIESSRPLAPETLCSEVGVAVRGKKLEGSQEVAVSPLLELVEETEGKYDEKRKRSRHGKGAAFGSLSASAGAPILEGEHKTADAVAPVPAQVKRKSKRVKELEQSSQSPLAFDIHLQGGEATVHGPKSEDVAVGGKKQEESQAAAASPFLELVDETGVKDEKRKKSRLGKRAAPRSLSATAGASILDGEHKTVDAVAPVPALIKRKSRRVKEQEQSSQSPLPFDIHLQGGKATVDGPKSKGVTVRRRSSSKKLHFPSTHEIIRMRVEARKQQPLPEGFLDFETIAANPNYSSPLSTFFDQFRYEPDRQQKRNFPPPPKTPDRPARQPPRGHSSSGPSQRTANGTSKSGRMTALNTSVSASQETVPKKDKSAKKMVGGKQSKPKPFLTAAEKWSDMYRRVPLDQLVPPPRSPHNLLQEKYASDPWKVIVICMLLNLTQGIQVRSKLEGFFELYPDPQTAYHADPKEMAEYLAPLGLQHKKAERIQKFSKDYVEKEWTHITELHGVGKYAADAYAIFCAGRATEVVPMDHKLVDYWDYVCNELPLAQSSENARESGMTVQLDKVVPDAQELAVCC